MQPGSYRMGELGEPVFQPSQRSLFQRAQVRRHSARFRIVPLAQFCSELKKPCQSIGTLPARASLRPQVPRFLRNVTCRQALPQSLACRRRERSIGERPDQSCQQPMSVDRRMPVKAAVERGRQFSWRSHIRIAVQDVTDLVRIFFMDAREGEIGKPLISSSLPALAKFTGALHRGKS